MRVGKSASYGVFFFVYAISLFGCTRGVYRAQSLPASLQAPPAHTAYQKSLAQLVRAVPPSEEIQPGDLLEVLVAPQASAATDKPLPLRVAEDGSLLVPLVGKVFVAGLRPIEAEAAIAQAARDRGIYRDPVVSINVKKPRTNRVTVLGAVRKEGVYELPLSQSTLLDALVAAGSLTEEADSRIEIHKAREATGSGLKLVSASGGDTEQSLPNLTAPGDSSSDSSVTSIVVDLTQAEKLIAEDYRLGDGDVVIVPKRPPQSVYVLGLVNRPGKIDIPPQQDLCLLDALAMAGGRTSELADRVTIVRQRQTGQPVQILASVRQAKRDPNANIRLAPGDVVSVEETPITMVERMLRYFLRIGVSASVPVL